MHYSQLFFKRIVLIAFLYMYSTQPQSLQTAIQIRVTGIAACSARLNFTANVLRSLVDAHLKMYISLNLEKDDK